MTPYGSGQADATWHPAAPWPGWAEWLGGVPLFAGLSRRHLKSLARLAKLRTFADGRTLVRAGAPGDAFYAILEGRAEVQAPGRRTLTLEAKDFFGELALIDGAPRSATVVAVGDLTAARVERSAFLKLIREEPVIARGLARGVVVIIRDMEGDVPDAIVAAGGDIVRATEATRAAAEPSGAEGATGAPAAGESAALLAGVPMFAELPKRRLRKVARVAVPRRYADGAVVARAGARGAVFHVIVAGRAQAVTPAGHTNALGPGECFGELSLLDGAPRSATVSAVGELETLRITRADFLRLLDAEPTLAVGVLRGLVALVRTVQAQSEG